MTSIISVAARPISLFSNLTATVVGTDGNGHPLAPNGVIVVSNTELLTLLFSLALVLIVSQHMELGVERQLAVGALRCFVQLFFLGLLLVPIITYNHAPVVIGYVFIMMLVAAVEAAARPPYVFDALILVCFVAITTAVALFGSFTFFIVIKTGIDAQYVIPITGMITGSAMSAVSVAVSNIVTEFAERRNNMEVLLALGATRWEASFDIIRSSIKLSLTPTLNVLSVTGLVSIPGMMTGQIIGGTPPSLAAKYQLVIMYIGAGTATIATLVASLLTIYVLIDSQYRIRAEKLYPRNEVNRIESLLKTFRFMTSHWTQWRTRVQQQQSPFPTYVNEPSPDAQSTQPLTASPSKFEESATGYGAPSASYQHTEDN